MDNLLSEDMKSSSLSASHKVKEQSPPTKHKLLPGLTWTIVVLALIAGGFLLSSDLFFNQLPHAPVSAAPLFLIGAVYLIFQLIARPRPLDLLKALIVSMAFILWGVDQLLPTSWFATLLGDIVITLYVIDLGWMMLDRLKQK